MENSMKHRLAIAMLTICCVLFAAASSVRGQAPSREARNAALTYWQAFALMRDPPADKSTADLLDSVATGKSPWNEARLGSILDANEEAIQTMTRGTKLPDCEWGIDWELGPAAPIGHLAKARVLGRLNTLAGMRLAAGGHVPEAIATWLAGVRFARHVAQGGSLISLLSARAVLVSNLTALGDALRQNSAGQPDRKLVLAALSAVPETGFDWGAAMQREQDALEVAVQQLARSSDLKSSYKAMMGQSAPADFSLPRASQMTAFRALMARATDALRLSPAAAAERLTNIEASKGTLNPFLAGSIPSLSRINAERMALKNLRDDTLKAASR
jgi:hypothetical protein